jgi:hypothetical protein
MYYAKQTTLAQTQSYTCTILTHTHTHIHTHTHTHTHTRAHTRTHVYYAMFSLFETTASSDVIVVLSRSFRKSGFLAVMWRGCSASTRGSAQKSSTAADSRLVVSARGTGHACTRCCMLSAPAAPHMSQVPTPAVTLSGGSKDSVKRRKVARAPGTRHRGWALMMSGKWMQGGKETRRGSNRLQRVRCEVVPAASTRAGGTA